MPGDMLFIVGGLLPVGYLALRMFKERKRYGQLPPDVETKEFVQAYD